MYNVSLGFIDFLGLSANALVDISALNYKQHICVYALSSTRSTDGNIIDPFLDNICKVDTIDLDAFINNYGSKFVKSDSAHYMCYKFSLSDVTTDSDTEPDVPYSYEELFNQCVLNHMSASDRMQYGYVHSAYDNSPDVSVTFTSFDGRVVTSSTKNIMLNDFYNSNSLASISDFKRSDYYKFYVPETEIVHDTSVLELNDDEMASVGNSAHASFNTLLYCINPNFDPSALSADKQGDLYDRAFPIGFGDSAPSSFNAVPISICTFSQDIMLAGQNVLFEPNLNGIVSVH